jgi:hypothetical protein
MSNLAKKTEIALTGSEAKTLAVVVGGGERPAAMFDERNS